MRGILIVFLSLYVTVHAQVFEAFSNGFFPVEDVWQGDTGRFVADTVNSLYYLTGVEQESQATLFRKSCVIEDAKWEFSCLLDFNPSGANYLEFFLVSDVADSESLSGYSVIVGGKSDEISLFRYTNGHKEKLIDGVDDRVDVSPVEVSVCVERKRGHWRLWSQLGEFRYLEGEVVCHELEESSFLGFSCHYTKTRKDKFVIGPIKVTGNPYQDTIPPKLVSYSVLNGNQIFLSFTEPVVADPLFFNLLPNGIVPDKVEVLSNEVTLFYDPGLPNLESCSLHIMGVRDRSGNAIGDTGCVVQYDRVRVTDVYVQDAREICLSTSKSIVEDEQMDFHIVPPVLIDSVTITDDTLVHLWLAHKLVSEVDYEIGYSGITDRSGDTVVSGYSDLLYFEPKRHDVVFSEVLFDPLPSIGLPECEFVELYNRSEYPINLALFKMTINDKDFLLRDFLLMPSECVVLSSGIELDSFVREGGLLQVEGMPVLNNEGGCLVLHSKDGAVLDAMRYDPSGEIASFKSVGGWSLERIGVNYLGGWEDNWNYSNVAIGGSPGYMSRLNEGFLDLESPAVNRLGMQGDSLLVVVFDEGMREQEVLNSNNFLLDGKRRFSKVLCDDPFLQVFKLRLSQSLDSGTVYQFSILEEVVDYSGNPFMQRCPMFVGKKELVDSADVVINEVLFNPLGEGDDFVEVVNRSHKVLDVSDLYFGEWNRTGELVRLLPLSGQSRMLCPDEILVATTNISSLKDVYGHVDECRLVELKDMPGMANDQGRISLCRLDGSFIDDFFYSEKMHFQLLNSFEGVSLERLNVFVASDVSANWHSASSLYGFATPTQINSQVISQAPRDVNISLSSRVFTPNCDGDRDFLQIDYSFDEPGNIGTVKIMSAEGVVLKVLASHVLMGTSGFFRWDGNTDGSGVTCPGIYIVWVSYYNVRGESSVFRDVCVLSVGR